jgi:hypothetical protein
MKGAIQPHPSLGLLEYGSPKPEHAVRIATFSYCESRFAAAARAAVPITRAQAGSSSCTGGLYWCEANDASLFISAVSLTHVAHGIDKLPTSQSQGNWLDKIVDRFGDRIHPVDAAIAMRAGSLLPHRTVGLPIHHFHDVPSSRRLRGTATAWSPAEIRSSGPGLMLRLQSFS